MEAEVLENRVVELVETAVDKIETVKAMFEDPELFSDTPVEATKQLVKAAIELAALLRAVRDIDYDELAMADDEEEEEEDEPE